MAKVVPCCAVNVEPEVKFLTIGMIQPGLEDITFTLPLTSTRGPTFTLRENSLYNLKFTFTVQRNLVSGLTYVNKVWKSGLLGRCFSRIDFSHQ